MPGRSSTHPRRSPLAVKLGASIREVRLKRGISQERLAERASLSKNSIGNIERGEFDVTVATLKRVADALGQSGAELLAAAGI
jgi:transcriptional regulator with XRE-family HTH domain